MRLVVAIGLLCACTASQPFDIKASDFDQTCTTPADCEAIVEGSGCCGCANAAVNVKADIHKYGAEVQQRASSCGGTQCTGSCGDFSLTCIANKCGVHSCRQPVCPADGGRD